MKPRTLALTLVAQCAMFAHPEIAAAREAALAPACAHVTAGQIAALFDRWNKALATKDPDAVVANYAQDATLLPTQQNGALVGRAEIRGYFVYFLKSAPQGSIDRRIIHIGCNIAYDLGLYTFTLDGDLLGSRVKVPARYTFIYAPDHGTWLIVHHHSSAMPEKAP